ncbi:MAG: hypothetical protein FD122_2074 [Stygiobacter sp.]|nr:MAG: hypothetical protein FD122_2074 [Stygiobacter sp.]KAF0214332.1 MAG: hypothetical protein FD178_2507 [Ignavibacteria bacterium]
MENWAYLIRDEQQRRKLVARTGVEPVISALRGRRPRPLDERAIIFAELN